MEQLILSVGGNLGQREIFIAEAKNLLEKVLACKAEVSAIYETPAWGFESSNAFLNAIFTFAMAELPKGLMSEIISIERRLGRKRSDTSGYTSRTIDIDVIAIGQQIISSDELIVPHPRMQDRLFVLKPMADVCPEWRHPIFNQSTRELLQFCTDQSEIQKWDSHTTT